MPGYDLGFNLAASTACQSGPGVLYAQYFFARGRQYQPVQKTEQLESRFLHKPVEEIMLRAVDLLEMTERLRLGAFFIGQLCTKRGHLQRLERVGGFVIAATDAQRLAIVPPTSIPLNNITKARVAVEGGKTVCPIIDLPTTQEERGTHPAETVIQAFSAQQGDRLYVALRGLEQIITVPNI